MDSENANYWKNNKNSSPSLPDDPNISCFDPKSELNIPDLKSSSKKQNSDLIDPNMTFNDPLASKSETKECKMRPKTCKMAPDYVSNVTYIRDLKNDSNDYKADSVMVLNDPKLDSKDPNSDSYSSKTSISFERSSNDSKSKFDDPKPLSIDPERSKFSKTSPNDSKPDPKVSKSAPEPSWINPNSSLVPRQPSRFLFTRLLCGLWRCNLRLVGCLRRSGVFVLGKATSAVGYCVIRLLQVKCYLDHVSVGLPIVGADVEVDDMVE